MNITTLNPSDPWATEAIAAFRVNVPYLNWICVGDDDGEWVIYGKVQQNHPGLFTIHHDPADTDDLRWAVGYTHDEYGYLGTTRLGDLQQVVRLVGKVADDPERAFSAHSLG